MAEGIYHLSQHARERLAERFGVEGDLDAERWLQAELRQTHILHVETRAGWHPIGRRKLIWFTADAMLVTEGNVVITVCRRGGHETESESEVA